MITFVQEPDLLVRLEQPGLRATARRSIRGCGEGCPGGGAAQARHRTQLVRSRDAGSGLRQYDRAVQCYERAIQTHPIEIAKIYDNLAAAYVRMGRDDLALPYFDKAIETKPKSGTAYSNRGTAYARLSQFDSAIQDYSRAIELKPRFPEHISTAQSSIPRRKSTARRWRISRNTRSGGGKPAPQFLKELEKAGGLSEGVR